MNEIRTLFEDSGMSVKDFSYAIWERQSRFERMLRGEIIAPATVLSKAHQVLADLDYWEAFFEANPDMRCSYKIFKYVLDSKE
jgi:hypothetical protein